MHVHFYTSSTNIDKINSTTGAKVWTKDEVCEGDIHISFKLSEYDIKHIKGSYYMVRQISSDPFVEAEL